MADLFERNGDAFFIGANRILWTVQIALNAGQQLVALRARRLGRNSAGAGGNGLIGMAAVVFGTAQMQVSQCRFGIELRGGAERSGCFSWFVECNQRFAFTHLHLGD